MFGIDNFENENLASKKFDGFLSSLIPRLEEFEHKQGGEGSVYFINDDFVVKKFYNSAMAINNSFLNYCNEMANFHDLGFCVPEFFAFKMIEDKYDKHYGLYILEERAKGREIYIEHNNSDLFSLFDSVCSKEEFENAMSAKEGLLFEKLMELYIKDFMNVNKQLLDVSDLMLENFILSNFDMRVQGKSSSPDVQPRNVLFDGKNLTMIDNLYLKIVRKTMPNENLEKVITLKTLVNLISSNDEVAYFINPSAKKIKSISKIYRENQTLAAKVTKRFVKKTNELLNPVIDKRYEFESFKQTLGSFLKEKDAQEIVSELQIDF